MSGLSHRARYRRKLQWVRGIISGPRLSLEEKKAPLWLSQYADENGTITHPGVTAMLDEALHGQEHHGS